MPRAKRGRRASYLGGIANATIDHDASQSAGFRGAMQDATPHCIADISASIDHEDNALGALSTA
jgi:hypothetical protein